MEMVPCCDLPLAIKSIYQKIYRGTRFVGHFRGNHRFGCSSADLRPLVIQQGKADPTTPNAHPRLASVAFTVKTTVDSMPSIELCECRFRLSRPMKVQTPQVREFFGDEIGNEIMSFGRGSDGTAVYEYPRIQFKIFESTAVLLGINEGCKIVQKMFHSLDTSSCGTETSTLR